MLKNAPMFKNMMTRGRGGAPRGKSGILRAQAGAGGRGRGRGMSSDRGGGRGDRGGRGGDRCKIQTNETRQYMLISGEVMEAAGVTEGVEVVADGDWQLATTIFVLLFLSGVNFFPSCEACAQNLAGICVI